MKYRKARRRNNSIIPEFINGFKIIQFLGSRITGQDKVKRRWYKSECHVCNRLFEGDKSKLMRSKSCGCLSSNVIDKRGIYIIDNKKFIKGIELIEEVKLPSKKGFDSGGNFKCIRCGKNFINSISNVNKGRIYCSSLCKNKLPEEINGLKVISDLGVVFLFERSTKQRAAEVICNSCGNLFKEYVMYLKKKDNCGCLYQEKLRLARSSDMYGIRYIKKNNNYAIILRVNSVDKQFGTRQTVESAKDLRDKILKYNNLF